MHKPLSDVFSSFPWPFFFPIFPTFFKKKSQNFFFEIFDPKPKKFVNKNAIKRSKIGGRGVQKSVLKFWPPFGPVGSGIWPPEVRKTWQSWTGLQLAAQLGPSSSSWPLYCPSSCWPAGGKNAAGRWSWRCDERFNVQRNSRLWWMATILNFRR